MKLTTLGSLLLSTVLLAGCGSDGGVDNTSPADRTLRAYFDGIATQTVPSLRDAGAAAQPGSPAAMYATYLAASTQAALDAGQVVDKARRTADRTAAGFRFCQGSGSKKICFDYTDITRSHGKVADFSVNGTPIADRLAVGTREPVAVAGLAARATFVAAYQTTAAHDLLVVVRITSGGATVLGAVDASYQSTGAAPTASAQSFGPEKLEHGSSANYMYAFPKALVGGTVTLSATDAEGHTGTVALVTR